MVGHDLTSVKLLVVVMVVLVEALEVIVFEVALLAVVCVIVVVIEGLLAIDVVCVSAMAHRLPHTAIVAAV